MLVSPGVMGVPMFDDQEDAPESPTWGEWPIQVPPEASRKPWEEDPYDPDPYA